MAILFNSWLVDLCALLIAFLAAVYVYFINNYQYWKRKEIPYAQPSFPFGNIGDVAMQRFASCDNTKANYRKFDGHKLAGTYMFYSPVLMVRDPEDIKRFLVKDFEYFHDRGLYYDEKKEPLSAHLFNMGGTAWRKMRTKLTPTFTSGKMKMMFPTMAECGKGLKEHLLSAANNSETIEIKDVMAKFTTDVIALCAFGIQCNCLHDANSEFREKGRKIFQNTAFERFVNLMSAFAPKFLEISRLPLMASDVSVFFRGVVRETVEYREKNNVTRNDFMELLIGLKNNKGPIREADVNVKDSVTDKIKPSNEDSGLTIDQVAAQAFIFFIAGFETSSTTLSFCLYELAVNQDIQDTLRDEVKKITTKHGGELTYESVHEMEYMDRVLAETMRKYPPLPSLMRVCTKEYRLPGRESVIDPGTIIQIPVIGLHHDPIHYPEPEVFDPERFTPEGKSKRHHYAYLPFGEGGRNCIGSRFGLMQAKVGLASIICDYKFTMSDEDSSQPLQMDPLSFIMAAKGGINLRISIINQR